MLVPQKVTVKWNSTNKKWFELKGYAYTNIGDEFEVDATDLTYSSKTKVLVRCDYCGELVEKQYGSYCKENIRSVTKKDCCKKCVKLKTSESMVKLYGTDNPQELDFVKEQTRQTCLEKYGCERPAQCEEIRNKTINTNLQRYGVENPQQNKDILKKTQQTNLERYGGIAPSKNKEVVEKMQKTCITKYGCINPQQNEEIRSKTRMTLYKNGTTIRSIPQEYLHKLIGGELNYPIGISSLDIALINKKIYCEYDGSGHTMSIHRKNITEKEFNLKEIRRSYALKYQGWKEIRIISTKDYLPSDKVIYQMIRLAKNFFSKTSRSWIKFDIDNSKIIFKGNEIYFNYEKLRKIKKSDLSIIA